MPELVLAHVSHFPDWEKWPIRKTFIFIVATNLFGWTLILTLLLHLV